MQEHITTVEIYGLLTTLPLDTEHNQKVTLTIKRDIQKGEKYYILYSATGQILIKFKVLDTDEDGTFRYQEKEEKQVSD